MGYKVKLSAFEGPFDLLVYLIENAQMNIYDIQVAEITTQYLEYIDEIKRMDVSMASEFMVLAATLIEIKSKMLLPRVTFDGEGMIEEDPRSELVERILEYKRFKRAAELLEQSYEYNLQIFEKPQEDISVYLDAPDEYLSLDINQFVIAFNLFLRKKQKVAEVKKNYEHVERLRVTIESRIAYIKNLFKTKDKKVVTFKEVLANETDRYNVVITFISLLEMVRHKSISLRQKVAFGEIVITNEKEFEKEAIQND